MSLDLSKKIERVLKRGVSAIYPSEDFLREKLASNKKMKIYLGVDPTGKLHLGHIIPLIKLRHFQDLGHKIIFLLGGFTATIGDPTGKISSRKILTDKDVAKNSKLYKKQISKILRVGFGGVVFKNNADWWKKMNVKDFLPILSLETVDRLIERDMFQERKKRKQPIFLHEFLYPILQGYDSVAMDVDGEVGGNDQIFNMLSGRDLTKNILGKEKFVLSTKLLTDNSGKKMGKTEGNAINLEDSPEEMFGKAMRFEDEMILSCFELLTLVDEEKINEIKKSLEGGTNPKDLKLKLALEITSLWHGEAKAKKAEKNFIQTFSQKQTPEKIREVIFKEGEKLVEVFLREELVPSKSEFQRLVMGGAIKTVLGEKIFDPRKLAEEKEYKIGKRSFVKLKKG